MNKPLMVVANWKMHLNTHEASVLVHRLAQHVKVHRNVEVVLAPSTLSLQPLSMEIDRRKFRLAAQDGYFEDEGAFTGAVSFNMMRDLVHYSIIGHSARRIYFNETLEDVQKKVKAAVRNGITPIICVGETYIERKNGESKQVIHDQLTTAINHLTSEEIRDVVLVCEPVWAISTFEGEVAKPDDIKQTIDYMRSQVEALYGKKTAKAVRILYGGSVNADDAKAFLSIDGCDGALVGAASLNYQQFAGIVDAAYQVATERE